MSGNTFAVVFSGKIAEGASVEQVKGNVARLFKVEVAKVERLFSGARVAIKKGLDEATAKKYQMALARTGALCEVVKVAAPAAKSSSHAVSGVTPNALRKAVPTSSTPKVGNPAPARTVARQSSAPKPGGLAGATLDSPGVVLVEHQEAAPLQVDLSGFSLDEPGVTLVKHEEVAPPQVDTSGLSVAESGSDIGKAETQAPIQVDLSGLSMDEPGATLVEHEEVPQLQIDTSKLSAS